jgi:hypothetical protein
MVRFAEGSGSLGQWGTMLLTGASSAVIKTPNCEGIDGLFQGDDLINYLVETRANPYGGR